MDYYKYNDLELSCGNTKLGTDTLIFNLGSATNCPSKEFCKLGDDCYALKSEFRWPVVKPFRDRQHEYWLSTSADEFIYDLFHILAYKNRINGTKKEPLFNHIYYFRYNESGDFYSQECVDKLNKIAKFLI